VRVVVSGAARPQRSMRFRGRSYMAFVLTPEPPIADWLSELDDWIRSSTGYFVGRPVVLELWPRGLHPTPERCGPHAELASALAKFDGRLATDDRAV